MAEANSDGIGIAWQTPPLAGKRKILFQRGIKLSKVNDLLAMIESQQLAYILHFRIATIGGVHKRLCHPFPVSTDQRQLFALSGEANYVLAHNGHWSMWDQDNDTPPVKHRSGPWSDSAAIAYIAAKTRTIWVPSGNRICTLHYEDGLHIVTTKNSGHWTERNGYKLSNLAWEYSSSRDTGYSFGTGSYQHRNYNFTEDECSLLNRTNQGNKYPCLHGRILACTDCLPTYNHLPIEVLPAHIKSATYTHDDNAILKGDPDPRHACHHPGTKFSGGHWHCIECTKCKPLRDKLMVEHEQIKTDNKKLIVDYSNSHKLADKVIHLVQPIKILPTAPACVTPDWCRKVSMPPCDRCLAWRSDQTALDKPSNNSISLVNSTSLADVTALEVKRQQANLSKPILTDHEVCTHDLPLAVYCQECEIADFQAMADEYIGPNNLLSQARKKVD